MNQEAKRLADILAKHGDHIKDVRCVLANGDGTRTTIAFEVEIVGPSYVEIVVTAGFAPKEVLE